MCGGKVFRRRRDVECVEGKCLVATNLFIPRMMCIAAVTGSLVPSAEYAMTSVDPVQRQ